MLMIHPQSVRTREQLRNINVVTPARAGRHWRGTQHGEFADLLVDTVKNAGFEVAGEKWGVEGPYQEDLFGVLKFQNFTNGDHHEDIPGGFNYCLGIRHSNRCTFAHTVSVGGEVTVCSNGMLTGETIIHRRHTSGLNLKQLVEQSVGAWQDRVGTIPELVAWMRALDLSGAWGENAVNRILLESGRRGYLNWAKVGRVDREWRHPRHPEFSDRTGFSLYNAFTEVGKAFKNPGQQIKLMNGVRELLVGSSPVVPEEIAVSVAEDVPVVQVGLN